MVEGAVNIYSQVTEKLKPTPVKCHYTFNLRDLSKVVQGILMVNQNVLTESNQLLEIYTHEVSRVFSDRMVSDKDLDIFYGLVEESLQKLGGGDTRAQFTKIMYSDIMKDDENKIYEPLVDMSMVDKRLIDMLEEYNDYNKKLPMNLIFFKDAVQHIARSSRILRQPRGNALLVGMGGSGRQSIARMSTFLAG